MPDSDINRYRKLFAIQIANDSEVYVGNRSREHACVIIQELIKSATKTIYIQCTRFSEDVYSEDVIDLINAAAARDCEVKIAIRKSKIENPQVENLSTSVELCYNTCAFRSDFCVVDGKRFRVEMDEEKRQAAACANDTDVGEFLTQKFEAGWQTPCK